MKNKQGNISPYWDESRMYTPPDSFNSFEEKDCYIWTWLGMCIKQLVDSGYTFKDAAHFALNRASEFFDLKISQ